MARIYVGLYVMAYQLNSGFITHNCFCLALRNAVKSEAKHCSPIQNAGFVHLKNPNLLQLKRLILTVPCPASKLKLSPLKDVCLQLDQSSPQMHTTIQRMLSWNTIQKLQNNARSNRQYWKIQLYHCFKRKCVSKEILSYFVATQLFLQSRKVLPTIECNAAYSLYVTSSSTLRGALETARLSLKRSPDV